MRKKVIMLRSNPFKPDVRVYKEAKSLTKNGFEVKIVAWDRECRFPVRETLDDITIVRIRVLSTYSRGLSQLVKMIIFWIFAVNVLRKLKIDVIHCNDFDTLPIGVFFKSIRKTKLVYDAFENYSTMIRMSTPRLICNIINYVESLLLTKADRIITASSEVKNKLSKRTSKPIETIGNWQEITDKMLNNYVIQKRREVLGFDSNFIVGYIGNFSKQRKIIPMIEAVKRFSDVGAFICGDGPQRQEIE